jgi:HK97 family phage major capsid protein
VIKRNLAHSDPNRQRRQEGYFCGDFSKYIVRTVKEIAIRRVEGPASEKDCVSFAAIWRVDGDLLDAGTHPVKYMRMGAT